MPVPSSSRILLDEPVEGLPDFMESLRSFFDLSHTFDVLRSRLFDTSHCLDDLIHAHKLFLVRQRDMCH